MKVFKNKLTTVLIIASLLQLCILFGEYLLSIYPIWVGKKVTLAINPVDPRSMFRGQYARLNFDIGDIKTDKEIKLHHGETVYVTLKEAKHHWIATDISPQKPSSGLFIRGRTRGYAVKDSITVEYGIEAYFASLEDSIEIERDLRRTSGRGKKVATAEVMVAPNGRATLVGINTKQLVQHETSGISNLPLAINSRYIEIGKRVNKNEFSTGNQNRENAYRKNAYCIECPKELPNSPTNTLLFDGQSSLYLIDYGQLSSQYFTIASWISLDQHPSKESVILAKQDPRGETGYKLSYITNDNGDTGFEASFGLYNDGIHTVFYPFYMKPRTWYKIALIVNGGKKELIVNGKTQKNLCQLRLKTGKAIHKRCRTDQMIYHSGNYLHIGSPTYGLKNYWRGRIARLSIFFDVLSKKEIKEHLNSTKPKAY